MKQRFVLFFTLLLLVALIVLSGQEQYTIYIVQKGDTLYSIAKQYNTTVELLLKLNNLSDASKIVVGYKLKVPTSSGMTISYTVQKGDTLFSIARSFAVSVDTLRTLNKLTGDTIKIGQVLVIPATGAQVSNKPTNAANGSGPIPHDAASSTGTKPSVSVKKDSGWPCEGQIAYLQGNLQGVLITAGPRVQVKTVRAGIVVSHGPFRGFATMIFVRASDGLIYVYGGIARSRVKVGDTVEFGAVLGETPSDDANDVFFFVFSGNKALDPAKVPRG